MAASILLVILSVIILPKSGFCEAPKAGDTCTLKLSAEFNKHKTLYSALHWTEPVKKGGVLECESGFNNDSLPLTKYPYECKNDLFNGTYKHDELLCRSSYHQKTVVTRALPAELGSQLLKCPNTVFHVKLQESKDKVKHLYTVCLDEKTMRPKFSFRLKSSEKHKFITQSRDDDAWGFDQYGLTTEDKVGLSRGYVQKTQKNRITRLLPEKYNKDKPYPYYFNRGHLTAFADFNTEPEQKTTVEYLNAAPQWDILNANSWSLVEKEVRQVRDSDPEAWELYTGTYGSIPTQKGPLMLAPFFYADGRFKKAFLPVPTLFWKIAYNTKDRSKSRSFIGVNNPEFKLPGQIPQTYRICTPVADPKTGKSFQGNENHGFTYECRLDDILNALKSENIVK